MSTTLSAPATIWTTGERVIEQDVECEGGCITEELWAEYLRRMTSIFPISMRDSCLRKRVGAKSTAAAKCPSSEAQERPLRQVDRGGSRNGCRKAEKVTQTPHDFEGNWDDGPLPTWVLAFGTTMRLGKRSMKRRRHEECSHAPTWINSFNPADKEDVRRVLERVRGFVTVNRQIVKLSKMFEKRRKSLGHIRKPEIHGELRAA